MNQARSYNYAGLLSNCCEDTSFVHTVVTLFIEHMPQYMSSLEIALAENNWTEMRFKAHTMKASIDLFDIVSLKSVIREIENQAKKNTISATLTSDIQLLKSVINDCILELKQDFHIPVAS